MPVRLPPLTERAQRILFEGIVDYAGLFPPASLSMTKAVRNYAHYRAGGAAWMLGRFICPANALDQFSQQAEAFLPRDAGAIPWRLAVVGSGDVAADLVAIAAFNERHRVCFTEVAALVDSYETRAASTEDVLRIDSALPRDLLTYIEVPLSDASESIIGAIAQSGRRVKLRFGGITADAFPTAAQVARALSACLRHDVTAKATAGLHHPLRGAYRLTYEDDAPMGSMFGFVNVFLAAALIAGGGSSDDAQLLLVESDATAFELNDHSIAWRGAHGVHHFDRALLQRVREGIMTSFGSCSFTEPVDESRRLGIA